ncbi:MAG: hypothetical protein U9R01_09290 [candidate division WOR-3 bacterium]|nr:hypothetical protein [candidate division WOR-3 bacterium]
MQEIAETQNLEFKHNWRDEHLKEYQQISNVSKRTATDDLEELVQRDALEKIGTHGWRIFYKIKKAIIGQIR